MMTVDKYYELSVLCNND